MFLTLEGVEGAGKSTVSEIIVAALKTRDIPVVRTREPGGCAGAERIRTLILGSVQEETAPLPPWTRYSELCLFMAARLQHMAEVIAPACARGDWVVCDRYYDSTYAYQGFGRGLATEAIGGLERWVQQHAAGLYKEPDKTLYLQIPLSVSRERQRARGRAPDAMEQEDAVFFERVHAGYESRAQAFPDRITVINAAAPLADVRAVVTTTLDGWVEQWLCRR